MGSCCGWPARGLNDMTENGWATLNPNFEYDGDESITLFPGWLSGDGTGTIITFAPVQDFLPWPRVLSGPFPLNVSAKVRSLCVAGGNVALITFTFATRNDFSGDYVIFYFSYSNVTGTYFIEIDGLASGVPFNQNIDTGIALVADREDDFLIQIGPAMYTLYLNGAFFSFHSGLDFDQVEYFDVSIQYTAANRQGMLGRIEVFTQAP